MIARLAHFLLTLVFSTLIALTACNRVSNSVPPDHPVQPDKETVLECNLEVKQDSGIFATVTFKNPTDHAESALKDVLLYERQITGPPFMVTKDGKTVRYTGRMIRRGPPTQEDWYVLEPGETLTRSIKINDYYDL